MQDTFNYSWWRHVPSSMRSASTISGGDFEALMLRSIAQVRRAWHGAPCRYRRFHANGTSAQGLNAVIPCARQFRQPCWHRGDVHGLLRQCGVPPMTARIKTMQFVLRARRKRRGYERYREDLQRRPGREGEVSVQPWEAHRTRPRVCAPNRTILRDKTGGHAHGPRRSLRAGGAVVYHTHASPDAVNIIARSRFYTG